jgi:GNAT superfamily N-acetyltransferase
MSLPRGLTERAPTADDLGFVLKSWIRSYANSPWAGSMSRDRQVQSIRGTVLDLIQRGMTVRVVCLTSRHDFLLGFIAYETPPEGPVVHYVYVKSGYRESGIASALLESIAKNAKVRTSHRTPLGDYLFKGSQYNPRLSRYQAVGGERERGESHPDAGGTTPQRHDRR